MEESQSRDITSAEASRRRLVEEIADSDSLLNREPQNQLDIEFEVMGVSGNLIMVTGRATRVVGLDIHTNVKTDRHGTWPMIAQLEYAKDPKKWEAVFHLLGGRQQLLEWDDGTPVQVDDILKR